jgi:hypothetical protein
MNGATIVEARIGVHYGYDKLVGEYDPTANPPCINAEYYDTQTDPFEISPQSWPGIRASRLRDHFTNLHATDPTSWGFGVPFC